MRYAPLELMNDQINHINKLMREIQMNDDLTLKELKEKYGKIVSDWNGSDEKFVSEGTVYTEADVQMAGDIVDALEMVEKLIESFNF